MENKLITRVVQGALANHREALAWSTTEDHVDLSIAQARHATNIVTGDVGNARTYGSAARKIEFMGRAVDRIDFHGSCDVEPSLLETQR
ncbi:hypothetical protein D9M72_598850 [compost metagenome]